MRKDIMSVLDLFREKGYACGYLTTNGTIITEERAEALADLAAHGLPEAHQRLDRRPGRAARRARAALKGTFERTAAGLRRLQEAARRKRAPLRVSINTTVAHETLDALDQMVDVAEELGVDAIGLNHLMFSTPEEVAETVRLIGAHRRVGDRHVRHAGSRAGRRARPRRKVAALARQVPRSATSCSTMRPKVHPQLIDSYYTPGAKLDGRCLYPFLHARVSFSRQGLLLPVHPRRGRRPDDSRRSKRSGTASAYVEMRRRLARRRHLSRSAGAAARSSSSPSRSPPATAARAGADARSR